MIGYMNTRCSAFGPLKRYLCELMQELPQKVILQFYECLNQEPDPMLEEKDNKVELLMKNGLYP